MRDEINKESILLVYIETEKNVQEANCRNEIKHIQKHYCRYLIFNLVN